MKQKINIEGIKKGERDAFKDLVLHYSRLFFTKAITYSRSKEDAEDNLQDAFVTIYNKASSFDGDSTPMFISWCSKIVIRTCLSHLRKNRLIIDNPEMGFPEKGVDPSIYARLGADELLEHVQALPEGYRQVFGLFAIEGYSHKEIGQLLGIKDSTSRSQYIRAKGRLRQSLSIITKTESYEV